MIFLNGSNDDKLRRRLPYKTKNKNNRNNKMRKKCATPIRDTKFD